MSAKGRGPSVGGPEDYFTTPSWCVRRLLEVWSPPADGLWLEPSAGNGAIIRAVNAVRSDVRWLAVELREEERGDLTDIDWCRFEIANFLRDEPFRHQADEVTVVLGNPPYSYAMEFLLRARERFRNAEIVFLLRRAFTASEDRWDFMHTHMPDELQLPNRPSFTGEGGGDSADYAWMRWPVGWERAHGITTSLALTSLSERKQDKGHQVMIEPAQGSLF